MPIKIVGIVFVFLVCSATGFLKSMSLTKRVRELEDFCSAFMQISTEIRYFASPTDVIISKLENMADYKKLRVFTYCKKNLESNNCISSAWQSSVDKALPFLSIDKEDGEIIKRFGDSFGTTDIEGQTANCEKFCELLKKRLETARADKTNRGKMYSSLGILAGIFFTIFFI